MDERCRHNQGPDTGSAIETPSAADAPPPAPSLLDLPTALLEDIMSRAMKLGAAAALARTCSALFLRVLQHTPALRIQLDSQRHDQLLSPRLVTALGLAFYPLTELQRLYISGFDISHGLMANLLAAMPRLHTMHLPMTSSSDQEVDALLAATQLTNIQLASIDGLSTSRTEALCSWQQLELTGLMCFTAAAHLPLHSLNHPLVMNKLYIWFEDDCSSLSSAAHNLTLVCEVPVKVKCLQLYLKHHSLSHLAVPQPLCCLGYTEVWLNAVAELKAADVPALASMSHTCTHLYVHNSSLQPTLDFWCQLVQLMPTVQQVTFDHVTGPDGQAMCESLQLMAEQPWARWLVITFSDPHHWELRKCWQAIERRFYDSRQPAKFRVSFGR